MKPSIKIVVATHKKALIPQDELYLMLQAGSALHPHLKGIVGDDTGDNISNKNESYCELTCLYWAWKNLQEDYIGLCHYRRYFGTHRLGPKTSRFLTIEDAQKRLAKAPLLLPSPRRYYIESTYSHYGHAHHIQDLNSVRVVLAAHYPAYLSSFDTVMSRTWGHRFNMMVMRRDLLDNYCTWLFGVLGKVETITDTTTYTAYDKRFCGLLAERLLDVWLLATGTPYTELPVVNTESQHWPKKIAAFLSRKWHGDRYERSGQP